MMNDSTKQAESQFCLSSENEIVIALLCFLRGLQEISLLQYVVVLTKARM